MCVCVPFLKPFNTYYIAVVKDKIFIGIYKYKNLILKYYHIFLFFKSKILLVYIFDILCQLK